MLKTIWAKFECQQYVLILFLYVFDLWKYNSNSNQTAEAIFLKWENINGGGQVTRARHHKTFICGSRIIETASVKTITEADILG
jgi:hypothetical protein